MKPSIPKGTRDFGPEQVRKRNYIFETTRTVFEKFGYEQIETPSMENLSTLTGKYGEEGDKLLFKVLNNGDYLAKADPSALAAKDSKKLTSSIAKRGMRYDLTVPFARYVVMHQNEISFPFKRYQIQPVWRADRPQKGRYQEFYQCDVDVVGSTSLMYEAEYIKIFDEVFQALGMNVTIKLNNRKLLSGIASVFDIEDYFIDLTIAIDKLDKIGLEKVEEELINRGVSKEVVQEISDILENPSFETLKEKIGHNDVGKLGIEEIENVLSYLSDYDLKNKVEIDVTLARGLNYYTGCIFEVQANDFAIGSICGGGRYDDLTGNFGLKGVSGVGVSFGAARIYDVMEGLNLFPDSTKSPLKVILVAMDQSSHKYAFRALDKLRTSGISSELYPSPAKMKKQMKYVNDRKVPYAIIIGSQEMETGQLALKSMETGNQEILDLDQIIAKLR